MSNDDIIEQFFVYHPPKHDQAERYQLIRDAGGEFARVILENTPKCDDQDVAIRRVRESIMTANAAIACNE